MKINAEVIEVLAKSEVNGNTLRITEQLDRDMYLKVAKVLKAIGGKWQSAKKLHVFENDVEDILQEIILTGEYTDKRTEYQFFPTPEELAKQLVSEAEIEEGEIIYSDPPWEQTKGNARKCRPRQGKTLDYETMSVSDCIKAQVPFFEAAAENHNVFMWSIDKFLHETEIEMQKLGYRLHARIIWDKTNGVAPAFTVRFSHEYLLWFYKPRKMLKPRAETRGKYTTVMRESSTYHSHKPICAYEMLEDMFPNARKIELFARNERDGWDCWGNEVNWR